MAKKRPNPSELADTVRHLTGRIDAVLHLASVLVAKLSPDLAVPLLDRIVELKAKSKSEPLSAYETGFASVESELLQTLKTIDDAQKIRDISGPAKH